MATRRVSSEAGDLQLPDAVIVEEEEESGLTKKNNANGSVSITIPADTSSSGEEEDPAVARGAWGMKIEFMLACIAFAVGLGNVWRFPYLCFRNGGGAFLIPYVTVLILMGLPIFFLEFAFGQFASLGPISVWSISPLFRGVGYAMTLISWYISLYYNVIIATGIFYLFASFTKVLPWSSCDNWWNNKETCHVHGSGNLTIPLNQVTSPAEEYYSVYVLRKSQGFHDFGTPVWHITLCNLLVWILVWLFLIKGVKSLGKVSYVTAIFPYIMLIALLVRAAFLEGSMMGIKYYLTPDFSKIMNISAWTDAATQIIFSLSCCNGGLIAMSSYNKFKNNCYRDAVIVATINCATSVFAGFVVFATLGFMAHAKGVNVADVVEAGPGLVFMVYPEALNQMPIPVLWSVLFFLMLITLGMGSQLPFVETVVSAAQDELRRYNLLTTEKSQAAFRAVLCLVNFLITIPMVCPGGIFIVNLVDSVMSGYPVLVVCLVELIVICYVYGLKQFMRDVRLMIDSKPNWYWRICWQFVSPLLVLSLLICMIVQRKEFGLNDYVYPVGIQLVGHLIAFCPVGAIIIWFVVKYCRDGGWLLLREFSKPISDWGPARAEHRTVFLRQICDRTLGYRPELDAIEIHEEGAAADGDAIDDRPAGNTLNVSQVAIVGSTPGLWSAASCQALSCLMHEGDFYQSKLSIAEKMVEKHAKDLLKQGIPPSALAASTEQLWVESTRHINNSNNNINEEEPENTSNQVASARKYRSRNAKPKDSDAPES